MKKTNFKKSTENEVQEILKLLSLGKSLNFISKRMQRDRTTIRWWKKKYIDGLKQYRTELRISIPISIKEEEKIQKRC